jgi:uncharacterized protein (DUF1778 family)
MTRRPERRSVRVHLRMTPSAKRMMRHAAAVSNKTLTEFPLETGLTAAFDTLIDGRIFELEEKQWAKFMQRLAIPPKENPRLRKLLARRQVWKT